MKKLLMVLALVAGTLMIGGSPAAAHTGDLKANYVCQKDGTYLVTYTLNISQTGLKGSTMWKVGTPTFTGTPGNAAGMDRGPVASNGAQTIQLGTEVYPGNATVGNWIYAYTTWSDQFKKGSDGRVDKFPGDCKPPKPNQPADKVVQNPATEEAANCETKTVVIHHSETTTPYVYDKASNTYVPGEPVVKQLPDTKRAATAQECPPPVVTAPNKIETSHTLKCGEVTITLRNVSPWIYPVSVEIDGVHSYGPTVDNRTDGKLNGPQKDASKTRTITFDEDSGEHTVRYRVQAGSERDLYTGLPVGEWKELTVKSDCQPPVTPPVVTPPAVVPTVVTPPVVEVVTPPAVVKVVTPPAVTKLVQTPAARPVPQRAVQEQGVLPNTGGPNGLYAALGLLLLAGGSMLLVVRRRSRGMTD